MGKRLMSLFIFATLLGCHRPYTLVPIVQTAILSKNWTDFRPQRPIHWIEPDGSVVFHVDSLHQRGLLEDHFELILPNGERCAPEVEVLGDEGRTLLVNTHGWGEKIWNSISGTTNPISKSLKQSEFEVA